MEKKIEVTDVLACQLMDDLACAYISFAGSAILDENGELTIRSEDLKVSEEWTRQTFDRIIHSLCEEFGVTTDNIDIVKTGKLDPDRFNNFWED